MIARRMCGHAALRRGVVKREDRVGRPARLERANLLKILAFEKQRGAAGRIEPRARQDGRAMDVRANPLVRRANGDKVEIHTPTVYFPSRWNRCKKRCAKGATSNDAMPMNASPENSA